MSKTRITDVTDLGDEGFRVTMSDGLTTRHYGPEVGARADVEASALAHWARREDELAEAEAKAAKPSTGGYASRRG